MANKHIKKCIQKSASLSGAYNITKKLKRGATILFYHGAVKKIINPVVQETQLPMDQFEKQMLYLKKNVDVISLENLYECISEGHKIDPSQVLLTFDDGYKNNLVNVAPFLSGLNMPFAIFISTRYIDNNDDLRLPYYYMRVSIYYTEQKTIDLPSIKRKFNIHTEQMRMSALNAISEIIKTVPLMKVNEIVDDLIKLLPSERWLELNSLFSSEQLMNWADVKILHNSGVTIGSHCHDHAILHSGQIDSEIDCQLKKSKELIEKYVGTCNYFSFPNGRMQDISHYSLMSVIKNRYYLGFTTVPGEVENRVNPLIIPRLFPHKDIDSFKFILNTSFRHNVNYYKWCSSF
jgi:peptidoglycan/xylan/chitin deacetylase (PgdA/CDA1 family)